MAEKKIVKAAGERKAPAGQVKIEGNASGLRIGAIVCWVLAIAMEVVCCMAIAGKFVWFGSQLATIIIPLIVDMAFVIAGSLMWKKANHIDPASEQNKLKFWLWNNMGVIVACLAFIPVIIYILTKKDLDPKTKKIATAVAAVAFAIAGVSSYDFNPVSQEQLQEQYGNADIDVYWVSTGEKYHTHADCQHLNLSTQDSLIVGSIGQAEEAGKTELCKTCYKKDQKLKEESQANGLQQVEEQAEEATSAVEEESQEAVENAADAVEEAVETEE